jgi:hypothetical protein
MVEKPEGPRAPEFAVEEEVVIDAEPVDERQVLVDAVDVERPRLVDGSEANMCPLALRVLGRLPLERAAPSVSRQASENP